MSNQFIIQGLSDQEIFDMDLETLAYMLLSDFSQYRLNIFQYKPDCPPNRPPPFHYFIKECSKNVKKTNTRVTEFNKVTRVLLEAFQWLYNNGLIMEELGDYPNSDAYFITRAGHNLLEQLKHNE